MFVRCETTISSSVVSEENQTPELASDQNLSSESQETIKRLAALMPRWLTSRLKATFLAIATAIQLVIYMALHWLVGRFFVALIASEFPTLKRWIEVLSAGIFFVLIVISLLELLVESLQGAIHLFSKRE